MPPPHGRRCPDEDSMPATLAPAPSSDAIAKVTGTLVVHDPRAGAGPRGHDRESRCNVARRMAQVLGYAFGGEHSAHRAYARPLYVVPQDALLARDAARFGIRGPQDVFGGVVPHAFIATKAITHPLVGRDAVAPDGWSHGCADRMGDAALRGYTAFSAGDARRAARMLLHDGPVRLKCVSGIGGSGQHLAHDEYEVEEALAAIPADEFAAHGVAVEEHLADAVTFSVGCVSCAGLSIAYSGTQRTTHNHRGHEVYGGSTLAVVRGGFASLQGSDIADDRRAAVALARRYDAAAFACYPTAYASRRNYDVLFGRDARGRMRGGVLEQSWRIGGATAAEVIALAAFRHDAARTRIRCATVEVYDDACPVPAGAFVHYRGVDPTVGPLTKYAVEIDGDDP